MAAARHTKPTHLREKKVAPKQIKVTFGNGPIGLELIERREGGARGDLRGRHADTRFPAG